MPDISKALYNMRLLDDLAQKDSSVHRINSLVKLLTTVIYLTVVLSFGRYEIIRLMPFVFYPVLVFAFSELPAAPVIKRILLVEPLVIGVGILNPLLDNQRILLGNVAVSRGWITFISLFIKSSLAVTAGILLIATTGMGKLASALRLLKIPKVFVLQLLLTYRYIYLLTEEAARMMRAYSLRAPGQKGVRLKHLGSFLGQMILRTFDRAQRLYDSMVLRGFNGDYNTGIKEKLKLKDFAYLVGWILFFTIARIFDIPNLLVVLLTGVIV